MTPEQWHRLRLVFDEARLLPTEQRSEYLERTCAGDPELMAELRGLLDCHSAAEEEDFLTPIVSPLTAPVVRTVSPGDRLGAYEIQGLIASGGMGSVYRAVRREPYSQVVAIKVMKPGSMDESGVARFRRECQVLADLHHPSIAVLLDAGTTADGAPWFAMEFIDGMSIDRYCDGRELPLRRRLELLEVVCRTIHVAHLVGIIHRDLKPGNILVTPDGTVKVVDFGLAKRLSKTDDQEPTPTAIGAFMGTPGYMAPEQAGDMGAPESAIVPATDVHALGAVLYVLITGRPPYRADSLLQTLLSGLTDDPIPPSRLHTKLPRDVETICLKCLRKSPAQRYSDSGELADDIRRHLDGSPILGRPVARWERVLKWARRRPAIAALWALALLSTLGGVIGVVLHEQRLREQRAIELVRSIGVADVAAIPALAEQLGEYRAWADPLLREALARAAPDSPEFLRAGLALLPVDDSLVQSLAPRLRKCSLEEFLVLRTALFPHRERLLEELWAFVADRGLSDEKFLRAASALAAYAPDDERWATISNRVAKVLVSSDAITAERWAEALRPVQTHLVPRLTAITKDADRIEGERFTAALLLKANSDRPELLVQFLLDENVSWLPVMNDRQRENVCRLLIRELELRTPPDPDKRGRRQAAAAAVLLRLDSADPVWPLLKQTSDQTRRSHLIHRLALQRVGVWTIFERLKAETDVSIRRALVLSLGEYREDQITEEVRTELREWLMKSLQDDPDSGHHSAARWLLVHRLHELDAWGTDTGPVDSRQWYYSTGGQSFAVVRGPVTFRMGDGEGFQKTIPRSFSVATHEVTAAQYRKFLEANPSVAQSIVERKFPLGRSLDAPVIRVSWFEAAQYCRWLSEQDGVPDDQMCYPTVGELEALKKSDGSVRLPGNYLDRTGYRLPTEAEWEYTCRAGSDARWAFGDSPPLANRYGYFGGDFGPQEVGRLKPNDLGMFDMAGNAMEWCHDPWSTFQVMRGNALDIDPAPTIDRRRNRTVRGGAWLVPVGSSRSAFRLPLGLSPTDQHPLVGFRVARTVPSKRRGASGLLTGEK